MKKHHIDILSIIISLSIVILSVIGVYCLSKRLETQWISIVIIVLLAVSLLLDLIKTKVKK